MDLKNKKQLYLTVKRTLEGKGDMRFHKLWKETFIIYCEDRSRRMIFMKMIYYSMLQEFLDNSVSQFYFLCMC